MFRLYYKEKNIDDLVDTVKDKQKELDQTVKGGHSKMVKHKRKSYNSITTVC